MGAGDSQEDSRGENSPVDAGGAASNISSHRIIGKGEMAERIRTHRWAETPLGPLEQWPREMLTIVNLMLASPLAARSVWGPEFILMYNDAYREMLGPRHPACLGRPAREIAAEAWERVGPIVEKVYATGETIFRRKLVVPMPNGNGLSERYLNYWFNPVYAEGKIIGLYAPLQDVTEEVLAARGLEESEARASRILESIGDAVIVTDAEARVTRMNAVAEVLTGWRVEDAQGQPLAEVFRIVSEDTREPAESPTEKVKRLGRVVGLANHTILIAKDGRETHIDDSGAPIRNDAGELIGIALVFRDINERRSVERERDALTAQLDQVLETTTDAILSMDRSWRITYLNSRARAIARSAGELLEKNFWECFPDAVYEGSPYLKYYYDAMERGLAGEFEAEYKGTLNIWVRVSVRPSRDGIVLFFRDITEEKAGSLLLQHTMDALRESEEELQWAVRLNPQVTWTANGEGSGLEFSDGWLELTGLTREEAMGDGWMQAQHEADMPEMQAKWRHSIASGEPFHMDQRVRTADGSFRWMRSSAYPRRDASGKIVKWYGTTEDIQDRKLSEEALIQSEKLAAVGRLASSIAHEINNPLEAVTNLIYLAQTQVVEPEAKALLETADQEIRRVSAIANQTLRFHKQPSNPQGVRSADLCAAVLGLYEGKLKNSDVKVETRFRAEDPVICFEGDIRQVLSNLIANAIDAMRSGGRLVVRSRVGTDWESGRRGVVLTVADTGCGMTPQVLRRIFDPFFTTKGMSGTGLGLWVSHEIVARHHGRIHVRSSEREGRNGTVFALFLPFER